MYLIVSIAWFATVVWLIFRAAGQSKLLQTVSPRPLPAGWAAPDLSVVVPMRDEADNIAACVHRLLDQSYPVERTHILLVDDHSRDATLAIATSIGAEARRLQVLRAPPLPELWTGKSHACWVGVAAAPPETQWFCFVDADVYAEPGLLSSALTFALAEDLDFLSLTPKQELKSFAERLVIPCGLQFLGFTQNLRERQSTRCPDATATGQFILVRASAYAAVGGHAAVRSEICEDVALARRLKRARYRVMLHDGQKLLSTRMYSGWQTLWPGLAKNISEMVGGQLATIGFACISIFLAWAAVIVPVVAGIGCAHGRSQACLALIPAVAGSAAAFALHVAGSFYFRIPFWYGLIFPIAYSVGAVLALDSVRRRWMGRVTWKGRTIVSVGRRRL